MNTDVEGVRTNCYLRMKKKSITEGDYMPLYR